MRVQLLKRVENIVTIVIFALFERFLPLQECFQNLPAADLSKCVCMWEGVNAIQYMNFNIS